MNFLSIRLDEFHITLFRLWEIKRKNAPNNEIPQASRGSSVYLLAYK